MTFDELKATILLRSRPGGLCEEYHSVKISTTYQELIYACMTLFAYGWKKGIVDTDILDEFDNDLLQENGIYYNRTGVVPEPITPHAYFDGNEIWIINGDPEISFNGLLKNKLTIINADPQINVNDTTFVKLYTYNSAATIDVAIDAVIDATLENKNNEHITFNLEGHAGIQADFTTDLEINFGVDAYAKVFSQKNSLTTVNIESTDLRIFALPTGKSVINYYEP